MNAPRPNFRSIEAPQLLQETLTHLTDAREFYLQASRSVVDREIRDAFAFSSEAHSALLQSLYAAAPAAQQTQAVNALSSQPSRTASVFADVAGTFDGRRPQASASELHALDATLLQRVEALFAIYPDMRVRSALKQHVLSIQRAGDATRRLALRNVA
jgi:hypothetical protein